MSQFQQSPSSNFSSETPNFQGPVSKQELLNGQWTKEQLEDLRQKIEADQMLMHQSIEKSWDMSPERQQVIHLSQQEQEVLKEKVHADAHKFFEDFKNSYNPHEYVSDMQSQRQEAITIERGFDTLAQERKVNPEMVEAIDMAQDHKELLREAIRKKFEAQGKDVPNEIMDRMLVSVAGLGPLSALQVLDISADDIPFFKEQFGFDPTAVTKEATLYWQNMKGCLRESIQALGDGAENGFERSVAALSRIGDATIDLTCFYAFAKNLEVPAEVGTIERSLIRNLYYYSLEDIATAYDKAEADGANKLELKGLEDKDDITKEKYFYIAKNLLKYEWRLKQALEYNNKPEWWGKDWTDLNVYGAILIIEGGYGDQESAGKKILMGYSRYKAFKMEVNRTNKSLMYNIAAFNEGASRKETVNAHIEYQQKTMEIEKMEKEMLKTDPNFSKRVDQLRELSNIDREIKLFQSDEKFQSLLTDEAFVNNKDVKKYKELIQKQQTLQLEVANVHADVKEVAEMKNRIAQIEGKYGTPADSAEIKRILEMSYDKQQQAKLQLEAEYQRMNNEWEVFERQFDSDLAYKQPEFREAQKAMQKQQRYVEKIEAQRRKLVEKRMQQETNLAKKEAKLVKKYGDINLVPPSDLEDLRNKYQTNIDDINSRITGLDIEIPAEKSKLNVAHDKITALRNDIDVHQKSLEQKYKNYKVNIERKWRMNAEEFRVAIRENKKAMDRQLGNIVKIKHRAALDFQKATGGVMPSGEKLNIMGDQQGMSLSDAEARSKSLISKESLTEAAADKLKTSRLTNNVVTRNVGRGMMIAGFGSLGMQGVRGDKNFKSDLTETLLAFTPVGGIMDLVNAARGKDLAGRDLDVTSRSLRVMTGLAGMFTPFAFVKGVYRGIKGVRAMSKAKKAVQLKNMESLGRNTFKSRSLYRVQQTLRHPAKTLSSKTSDMIDVLHAYKKSKVIVDSGKSSSLARAYLGYQKWSGRAAMTAGVGMMGYGSYQMFQPVYHNAKDAVGAMLGLSKRAVEKTYNTVVDNQQYIAGKFEAFDQALADRKLDKMTRVQYGENIEDPNMVTKQPEQSTQSYEDYKKKVEHKNNNILPYMGVINQARTLADSEFTLAEYKDFKKHLATIVQDPVRLAKTMPQIQTAIKEQDPSKLMNAVAA